MKNTQMRIRLRETGTLLPEGPLGWGITPFEVDLYISKKYPKTNRFRANLLTGLRIYKFLYVWSALHLEQGQRVRNLAWMYWLSNSLVLFIWFRVAIPRNHPALEIEEF